ncbi:AAA family ATPase [Nocardioides daejeonensis]|uniref:AAA family ATPase n=1 Tax=Nocardioides daejeonensis TaxID=1046556 RepID=UPI000D74691B|nr:SMC family ATPase [Nocardioides daejeonensis]
MRLHHLEIQAFGPFPEPVEVDFDELSEAGLFLLAGPTGAGKTSVLDAVCFALYGDVPGDRGAAKRLRCDSAPADLAPRVRLEVTLAGRRFRFTRSPLWQRPKRRGAGLTTEQAKVVCEERRGDSWHPLSTRLDETGHLVTGLLGMTMGQFCQVALLPQGEFQGFLRARSEERHHLLQQLFATGHFEEIERWLREHAREAGRNAQQLADRVAHLLSRFGEAADGLTREVPLDPVLDGSEGAQRLREHTTELLTLSEQIAADTEVAARAARTTAQQSGLEWRAARETHAARLRGREAQQQLGRLALADERRAQDQSRLSAAGRAAPLLPLHRLLLDHTRTAAAAAERSSRAWERLAVASSALGPGWGTGPSADTDEEQLRSHLDRQRERLNTVAGRLGTVRPAAQRRQRAEEEVRGLDSRLATLGSRNDEITVALETLPQSLVEAESELTTATDARREHALLTDARPRLEAAVDAAQRLRERDGLLIAARAAVAAATDEVQQAREVWLDLREQRINGMAAELAAGLAVGAHCPVCGSDHHPAPATSLTGSVTAADERAARARLTDLEFAQTSAREEERALAEEVTALRATVGDRDLATLDAELVALDERRRTAQALAAREPELTRSLECLRERERQLNDEAGSLRSELASLEARRALLVETIEEAGTHVAALLQEYAAPDLDTLQQAVASTEEALTEVSTALAELAPTRLALAAAEAELAARLADSAFVDIEEGLGSALDPETVAKLQARLAEEDRLELLARATLEEAEVAAALDAPPADLAELERVATAAEAELTAAAGRADAARRRAARLRALADEVKEALAVWQPAHERHRLAADLAAFVEGKSVDNVLKMRLSGYVLAWRLTQVVDAANERLHRMTGSRYALVHTDRRGSRETRGGLSLAVLDAWTGESREPATLSGGETFVVSLALALGLADVVTAEAGGSSLDTLFVDEGFGSLDSETLDDVLDTLDELREGGRVVGVVSHVAEMRSRIPTQLLVTKDPRGSSLRIRHHAPR